MLEVVQLAAVASTLKATPEPKLSKLPVLANKLLTSTALTVVVAAPVLPEIVTLAPTTKEPVMMYLLPATAASASLALMVSASTTLPTLKPALVKVM